MKNNLFAEKIIKFTDLLLEVLQSQLEGQNLKIVLGDKSVRFETLWKEIIEELVWNPGRLVYIEDRSELERARVAIEFLINSIESEEIFDEMIGGDYTSLLVNIMGEYSDRIKLLRPTFISTNKIDREFVVYFSEAMQSWLLGLTAAPLIIVCSLLENILKTHLEEIDSTLVYDSHDGKGMRTKCLDKLIQNAKDVELLSPELANKAFKIKNLRNTTVHNLRVIHDEESYQAIIDIKDIVEYILNESKG